MSEDYAKQDVLNEEFIKRFFKYGVLLKELDKYRTNHILHLLLTILTGGLWLIVWFIVAQRNHGKRIRIERKLGVATGDITKTKSIINFVILIIFIIGLSIFVKSFI